MSAFEQGAPGHRAREHEDTQSDSRSGAHAAAPEDTVILIHGTCMGSLSWEHWMSRYTARGYCVIATGAPEEAGTDDCLAPRDAATVANVVTYYERLLLTVAKPPILIGHCFGGEIVQLLLDRGLGAAGVVISGPPAAERRPRAFGLAARVGRRADQPGVDYGSRTRPPLLLVGAGLDFNVPPELVEATALRYQESDAVSGYLEYPEACHHALRSPGWEQLADDVLDWAELYAAPERFATAGRWKP
ncbi:MAG: alpha/beta hydrolase [Catenulispora sp.]|nr:alpha/beta hydrolase [Catenulispora sp.]